MLELLASQAAIALENTRLYRDLAQREAKIRRLVDANIVGIMFWDLDGGIRDANDAFLHMVGYESADLVSGRLRWTDLTPAEWLERDREIVEAQVKLTGRVPPYEKEFFRKDGSRVPVLIGGTVFDEENKYGIAFVVDITARKCAEEELRRNQHYLAEAQKVSHTGSWAWSPVSNAILYWSEECYRILGYDPAQGLPSFESSFERIHPEDRPALAATIERAAREKTEFQIEYRLVLPDDRGRIVRLLSHPVLDASGEVAEFVGTVMDVTEHKRAEEERREYLWFLESMDRINRAMQRTNDVELMTSGVIQEALEIFACDHAFLCYPCDPDTPTYRMVMDHTSPEYGGDLTLGRDVPMTPEGAEIMRRALHHPETVVDPSVPPESRERFRIGSQLAIAVRPKGDRPYLLVVYSSRSRPWTAAELRLFEEIAQRLGDALTSMLAHRNLIAREMELRRSQQYLTEGQKLSHTGSWAWNPTTNEVPYWSQESYRIYGFDPAQGIPPFGTTWERVHPEDREALREAIERGLREKAGFQVEHRLVLPGGVVRNHHVLAQPVLNASGELIEYLGTVVDVTERKLAEKRLLVQYRVTRILADAATVEEAMPKILQAMCECLGWELGAVWRMDPQAGVLHCTELWRASSVEAAQFEEVTRKSIFRPGSGLPGRVWETGAPEYIQDVGRDLPFGSADSATRPALSAAIAFPILLGSDILGVIGFVSHDVSQPDQELLAVLANIGSQIGQFTKRTAAVNELQLRVSMLQQIPVAAWSVTPDGTSDIVNRAWFEYSGQTPEYVNSHPEAWMAVIHPEDRESASRIYWDGIRSGHGFSLEARFLRASDATYRWHLNRAVPVRSFDGNIVRFVGTSTDVHDWRQAQEALRNTQAEFAHMTRVMTMGELTASIAHEVNQPLGAIVTSAAAGARWLATKPPQMDKARRALERIANDGKRAGEVIRRIRELMKRQAPRKEWLDINETILEVIALAQHQLRQSEILLETRLGQNLPRIRGDRVQLQQVLLNLVINAIDAMCEINERPRELTIVSKVDGVDAVSVEVRDSGTGLDPEHAPHLFEAFYTTKAEGLGVGLSISRSIVEAHGGHLSASANAPHGTVFHFSLPVNEPAL
jgi:PAS domain S-box-containing protein